MPKNFRLVPKVSIMGVGTMIGTECTPDVAEARGIVLQLAWLGLVPEFVVAVERGR